MVVINQETPVVFADGSKTFPAPSLYDEPTWSENPYSVGQAPWFYLAALEDGLVIPRNRYDGWLAKDIHTGVVETWAWHCQFSCYDEDLNRLQPNDYCGYSRIRDSSDGRVFSFKNHSRVGATIIVHVSCSNEWRDSIYRHTRRDTDEQTQTMACPKTSCNGCIRIPASAIKSRVSVCP